MKYDIAFEPLAEEEMEALRTFEHRRIMEAIAQQLCHEPTVETRNRKELKGAKAAFRFDPPLWELRVGQYRVFYDVDEKAKTVAIRSVRKKRPDQTTEDVTNA